MPKMPTIMQRLCPGTAGKAAAQQLRHPLLHEPRVVSGGDAVGTNAAPCYGAAADAGAAPWSTPRVVVGGDAVARHRHPLHVKGGGGAAVDTALHPATAVPQLLMQGLHLAADVLHP